MTPNRNIEPQTWMTDGDLGAVFAALQATGDPVPAVLSVGGCVRDALMGWPVVDIDLATVHPPETVKARLAEAGIATLDIGIDHGTVVANFGAKQCQITTLRRDVETDGRHATVAFTDDWMADASRRDFTVNALYADLDGNVFDPLGGMTDVEARRVRFIGDAGERIREDALRIMRFFRFHAQFELPEFDQQGLDACRAHFDLLANLSGERIRGELFKILLAPADGKVLNGPAFRDLFEALFPVDAAHFHLAFVAAREDALGMPDPLRRLSVLVPDPGSAAAAATRLRLSNDDTGRLAALAAIPPGMTPELYPHTRKLRLYALGPDRWRDAVILSWARAEALVAMKNWANEGSLAWKPSDAEVVPDAAWLELLKFPETWPVPEFPLKGADVVAAGVPEGPEVGRHLAAVENWWMIRDFRPDHAACVTKLKRRLRWGWLRRPFGGV